MLRFLCLFLFASLPLRGQERDPARGIVFCTYNVKNYLGGVEPGTHERRTKPKPEAEIEPLIRIIREINPDILGVCEMGSPAMFDDFKARLEKAGLGYKDSEYLQANDTERHLGLVSRFPIVERHSEAQVRFVLNGFEHSVKRGILDVTIRITPAYQLRCVGVHLKSKLPAPDGEAMIRRNEAMKLREHLNAVLKADPDANVICYGDFNDAKNSPMFAEVSGVRGTPTRMTALAARDSVNDAWTHHWPVADEYTRIDYLFVAPGLWPEVRRDTASVYRSAEWEQASDHRPVHVTIVPIEKGK